MGRFLAVFVALSAALVICVTPSGAAAETARETFERAVVADDSGELAEALELYRQSIEADPSARFAARALARVRALEPLLEDEEFAALEAIQRNYARGSSNELVTRAEALLESQQSTAAEVAIRDWLGNEYATVLGNPDAAITHFLAVSQLESATPGEVETALVSAARAAQTRVQLRRAADAIDEVMIRRADLDPAGVARARGEVKDALQLLAVRPMAWTALALLAGVAATRRQGWRRATKRDLLLLLYIFAGGALLAERWEHGYGLPFACALPAVAIVHILGVAARPRADAGHFDRAATATLIALATFGAVFLAFDLFGQAAIFGL